MKKFLQKLKDLLYGALPLLILFAMPTAIGLIIFITSNWDNLKDLSFSDITLMFFAAIGAFNIGIGILLAVEKISAKKLKVYWIYIYLILTAVGIFALRKISI